MVNVELFTTKTRDEWVEKDLLIARQGGATMHISILAMPDPEDTAMLVEEIQSTGMADILELNVSCRCRHPRYGITSVKMPVIPTGRPRPPRPRPGFRDVKLPRMSRIW
jgi:hypothetical protein